MSCQPLWKPFVLFWLLCGLANESSGQELLQIDSPSFAGAIHDNISNKDRQGSGLNPLVFKAYPDTSLFRKDAVGINFEHIFNGAKKQHDISMFTPRQDTCRLKKLNPNKFELYWPAEKSKWGMEARMTYDFSIKNQIDLQFDCKPTKELFSQQFVAMMWASYMNAAVDRKIHFWGKNNGKVGWTSFGEGEGKKIEVGTIASVNPSELSYEKGAQTLNLFSNPTKKFITPFYYGVLDGDNNFETKDDRLLFLVLFDQTDSIRFAMWNFYSTRQGDPDTHSPAWDWQYVIRNPKLGQRYRYRARIVVRPFRGVKQVGAEYQKWIGELGKKLPPLPMK